MNWLRYGLYAAYGAFVSGIGFPWNTWQLYVLLGLFMAIELVGRAQARS